MQVLSSLTPSLMREKYCIGPIRSNRIASKLQNIRPLVVGCLCTHYEPEYFKPDGYSPGEVEFLKKPITKIGKDQRDCYSNWWGMGKRLSFYRKCAPATFWGRWMALLCLQLFVLAFTADTRAECTIQVYNSNHKIGSSTELLYHSLTDIYKSAFWDKICMHGPGNALCADRSALGLACETSKVYKNLSAARAL